MYKLNTTFLNSNFQNQKKNIISDTSVFMNIDVKPHMCQGIYFNKNGEATICKNKARYLKEKTFYLCEKHKNQKFHY
jgi:hypothetical protein